MVYHSFTVTDDHGNIRGVAMIDTQDTTWLHLVPNIVDSSNSSSSISSGLQSRLPAGAEVSLLSSDLLLSEEDSRPREL